MPFLTEELWHAVYDGKPPAKSIALTRYPSATLTYPDKAAINTMSTIQALVELIGELRKKDGVAEEADVPVELRVDLGLVRKSIENSLTTIRQLAHVKEVRFVNEISAGLTKASWLLFDVAIVLQCTNNVSDEPDIDAATPTQMILLRSLISVVRNCRKEVNVPEKELVPIKVYSDPEITDVISRLITDNAEVIQKLAKVESIEHSMVTQKQDEFVLEKLEGRLARGLGFDVRLVYEATIDAAAERERLTKDIAKYEKGLAAAERQLGNDSFLSKAPAHVVEGLKKQEAETRLLLEKAQAALAALPKE
jgi:valyl-tRNA synthetase